MCRIGEVSFLSDDHFTSLTELPRQLSDREGGIVPGKLAEREREVSKLRSGRILKSEDIGDSRDSRVGDPALANSVPFSGLGERPTAVPTPHRPHPIFCTPFN